MDTPAPRTLQELAQYAVENDVDFFELISAERIVLSRE